MVIDSILIKIWFIEIITYNGYFVKRITIHFSNNPSQYISSRCNQQVHFNLSNFCDMKGLLLCYTYLESFSQEADHNDLS